MSNCKEIIYASNVELYRTLHVNAWQVRIKSICLFVAQPNIDRRHETITIMLIIFHKEMGVVAHDEGAPVADVTHVSSRPAAAASYPSVARSPTTWQCLCTRMASRSWAPALCRSTGLRTAPSSPRSWMS